MSEILGRDPELDALRSFVQLVPEGPSALTLEGEAGIGKTTLWNAGGALAIKAGFRILKCQPSEAERQLSYIALSDLLSDTTEIIEHLPEPQRRALNVAVLREEATRPVDQRTVAAGTLGVLRALSSGGPLLLAVDDQHWLDPASAFVLAYCLRRLVGAPIGILSTLRTRSEAPDPMDLGRVILPGRLRYVRLEPLGVETIRTLIDSRLDRRMERTTVRRIHDASGGNPFFALEFARSFRGINPLAPAGQLVAPEDLRDVLRGRLVTFPADAKEVLLIAAASARPTVTLVEEVIGDRKQADSVLDRATAAGVLEIIADDIRFTHPLFASAVYADASELRRRRIHGRLADAAADEEERARHLALSSTEPDADMAASLEKAARHASERGAPGSAAELLGLAVSFTPAEDIDGRRDRQIAAADGLFLAGDQPGAISLLRSVVAASRTAVERANALVELSRMRLEEDLDDARHLLLEALDLDPPEPVRAEALVNLAIVALNLGDLQEAEHRANEALELARSIEDPERIVDALGVRALPRAYLGHGIDRAGLSEAERLVGSAGSLRDDEDPRMPLAELLVVMDEPDEARDLIVPLLERSTDRGDEPSVTYLRSYLIRLERNAGRWDVALKEAAALELRGDEVASHTALINANRGRFVDAREEASKALEAAESSRHILVMLDCLEALGAIELLSRNYGAGHRHLHRAWELYRATGAQEPNKAPFVPDDIEALVGLHRFEEADALTSWLEERGRSLDRPRALASGARCRAILLSAEGDLDGALASAERALREHERLPNPFQYGRTLLAAGTIRRRNKQKRGARDVLEQALAIFEGLRAEPWIERVRAEVAAIGGRAPATGALTPGEERVARLAAEGRSNQEIADALFLSLRTVEGHLSHSYAKLGINSRSQLFPRLREDDEQASLDDG